ncbi:sugar transferase [bacterium]|nr:sugar transferase [bacterium]
MRSFWKSHFLTLCLIALDILAMSFIWSESWQLRHALNEEFQVHINPYAQYQRALPLLIVSWVLVLAWFGQYSHKGKISSLNQVRDIIKSTLLLMVLWLAVGNVTKNLFSLGNSVIAFALVGGFVYLYASRTALKFVKDWLRSRRIGLTRVAIIGAGETGRRVALRIQHHPEVGYDLVGFIDRRADQLGAAVAGVPVIGDCSDLANLLLRHRVEEVFLAIPSITQNDAFAMVLECESANVNFKIVKNDLLEVITDSVKIDDIDDFPVILLREGRLTPLDEFAKRAMDLAITVPLLTVTLPLWVGIAIAIKLDSKGSILFSHDRVGKDGRIFRMHKFRTMAASTNPYAVAPGDQSDPRITRVGRFLRKTSLDEIPQFLNVLKGEMSLVGPRPEMPFIVAQYEPWQRRRLDVPQGITGLWQIAGRKQLPLHYNLEYDFYYIRNWNLLLDIVILFRTIPAVFLGKGAF